uniref:Tubulin polyglutamylase TTLL11 n=1 Tax=Plectus sambesii TaxID=2011161 RepID=A0A914WD28_9BILA
MYRKQCFNSHYSQPAQSVARLTRALVQPAQIMAAVTEFGGPKADEESQPSTRPNSSGGASNTSTKRQFRSESIGRVVSVDTSRARSNLEVVSLCAEKLGFVEYPEGRRDGRPCDIYWHNIIYSDMKDVVFHPGSRVNKFPGMNELAKKIPLTRAISSMQRLFPDQYDFYPRSWFIPAQLDKFNADYKNIMTIKAERGDDEPTWFIVKPDEGAQGTGIYLIHSPDQLQKLNHAQLIQEYIAEPFLLSDNLKFDFRVYGVIKSLNPLSIHVAREGMARFCTETYRRPSLSNQDQVFVHLTNYSLNKSHGGYIHSNTLEEQLKGSKRLLSTVFHQMEGHGIRTKRIWHNIKLIVVKTVLAMVPEMMLNYEHHFAHVPQGPQCFQILGFDILLTKDLRPILLEVNASPSLTIGHTLPPTVLENQVAKLDSDSQSISTSSAPDLSTEPEKVHSVVDEVIKVPLVRDAMLLVMGQLDSAYNGLSTRTGSESALNRLASGKSLDDSMGPLTKKKAHLREVFPARYGQNCWQLLFLDKAVYLYMQFVNTKKTILISSNGFRTFVRKCNLFDVISPADLDKKFVSVEQNFLGGRNIDDGIPFHGFLDMLFFIAQRKYPDSSDLIEAVQALMKYCQTMLRHFGVRSARLRREEVLETHGDEK